MGLNVFYEDNSKMHLSENMHLLKSYVKLLNALEYDMKTGENEISFMNSIQYADVDYFKEELDKPDDFGSLSLYDPKAHEPWLQMCNDTFLYNLFIENFAPPIINNAYANLYNNLIIPTTEFVSIDCKGLKDDPENVQRNFKDGGTLHFYKSETEHSVAGNALMDNPVSEDFYMDEHEIVKEMENRRKLQIEEEMEYNRLLEIERKMQLQILEEMENRRKLQIEEDIKYKKQLEITKEVEIKRQLEVKKEIEEIWQFAIVEKMKKGMQLKIEEELENSRQLEIKEYQDSYIGNHQSDSENDEDAGNTLEFILYSSIVIIGLFLIFR